MNLDMKLDGFRDLGAAAHSDIAHETHHTRAADTFLTRHKNKTSDACARVRAPGPAGRGLAQ
jgi:hypothetical protein